MTGRKPTPSVLIDKKNHKKSNEQIEKRVMIETALKATSKLKCPTGLSIQAKKEWKKLIKLYNQMEANILSDLDIPTLITYCEAVAIYKKAEETWVQLQQVVSTNSKGQALIDKCIKTMNDQTKIISNLAEQLCLTPVGRARMGMMKIKNTEDDPLEELGF